MKKLSEIRDGDAIELLADLIEPISEIATDEEARKKLTELSKDGASPMEMVKPLLKTHKDSILKILAIIDGTPVEEYHCNAITLPLRLIEILNDKELLSLFS